MVYQIQKHGSHGWKKFRGHRSQFRKAKPAHARIKTLRHKGIEHLRLVRYMDKRTKTRRSR